MANGAAIGPTDAEINALPIESPASVYDLRNAAVALSPQAGAPLPGVFDTLDPRQSASFDSYLSRVGDLTS